MHSILALIHDYGSLVEFTAVLIEGVGIPVPAFATIALTASVFDRQRLWSVFFSSEQGSARPLISRGISRDAEWVTGS